MDPLPRSTFTSHETHLDGNSLRSPRAVSYSQLQNPKSTQLRIACPCPSKLHNFPPIQLHAKNRRNGAGLVFRSLAILKSVALTGAVHYAALAFCLRNRHEESGANRAAIIGRLDLIPGGLRLKC